MFCYKCGKQIPDEAAFCPYCGATHAAKSSGQTGPTVATTTARPQTSGSPVISAARKKSRKKCWAIALVALALAGGAYAVWGQSQRGAEQPAPAYSSAEPAAEPAPEDMAVDTSDMQWTGLDDYYIAYDPTTGAYGVFDTAANAYKVEPVFEEVGDYGEDAVAIAKKNGYYGYIDQLGDTVISFSYDDAMPFENGFAEIVVADQHGVIDLAENYILMPEHDDIRFLANFIAVQGSGGVWGLYSYAGELILEKKYYEINFINNRIFAQVYAGKKFELFDYEGNSLFGSGELAEAVAITLPVNGVSIVYYDRLTGWRAPEYVGYCRYVDEDLNVLHDTIYCASSDYPSTFSKLGYATARLLELVQDEQGRWSSDYLDCCVVKLDGTQVCSLPKTIGGYARYLGATEFYALLDESETYSIRKMFVVDLETQEMTGYRSVEMVDGTNCIIVVSLDSDLYGLYDGKEMVYQCVCNEIYQEDGRIFVTRGADTTEYMPK